MGARTLMELLRARASSARRLLFETSSRVMWLYWTEWLLFIVSRYLAGSRVFFSWATEVEKGESCRSRV